ncbi:MAG: hypothetical protein ACREK8_09855, partial [Gemmatimonadales bacterium]
LDLVRIGSAQRPEFAAWRYGDQFGRRRWRYAVQVGGLAVAGGALVFGGGEIARMIGVSGGLGFQLINSLRVLYQGRRAVVRISTVDDDHQIVSASQLGRAAIHYHGDRSSGELWSLAVPLFASNRSGFGMGREEVVRLHGPFAVEALGRLLPRLNASGGSRQHVRDAVELIESRPDQFRVPLPGRLKGMDHPVRLALEMAAHEASERAALAGELKLLERAWRRADELAAIADSLAVTDDVNARVDSAREK